MNTSATPLGKALITGASSGIGAVYADRLARRGHPLVLVARDARRLAELAARMKAAHGVEAEVLVADLTQTADLRRVEARLESDAGISLLVNNAGVGATAPLVQSTPESLDAMLLLNVLALTRLTRAAVPGFVARGRGAVINIASIVALAPELLNGVYSGSKAFVVNLSQSLHHEVGDKGVQVQAVLPGATHTDFWRIAGVPVEHLPEGIVMSAEDMVDAALVGFDRRELITIPSLPDVADWERADAARRALGPNLSRPTPAERYGVALSA
ncbi:SDR family oxidoreductase [Variovorax sp. UMC13]|uniref:SDR family NAD(P)-dependent oxidoreductase n=1 Tax=Variovorax sp. UMC13 TaxID=1862326 RepID=UPI0016041EB6|nr:SDR family oxidoreductase [Variovorax sp. UMC13]MBB1598536.1 SDR family oxidoreductase [Variovorax sp. UMC13]